MESGPRKTRKTLTIDEIFSSRLMIAWLALAWNWIAMTGFDQL